MGTAEEHESFEREIGSIQFIRTADMLELAQVIAGAYMFVGNQSAAFAIAEGLKLPIIQETCTHAPNCVFERDTAFHITEYRELKEVTSFARRFVRDSYISLSEDEEAMLSLVPPDAKRIVLVGTDGRMAELLASRFPFAQVAGDDYFYEGDEADCVILSRYMQEDETEWISEEIAPRLSDAGVVIVRATNEHALCRMAELLCGNPDPDEEQDEVSRSIIPSRLRFWLSYHLLKVLGEKTVRERVDESFEITKLYVCAQPIEPMVLGSASRLGPATKSGTSVVVVTYNSAATLGACLESVLPTLGDEDELIVVDNCSSDGTVEVLERHGARQAVHSEALSSQRRPYLICNDTNRGYSAAANQGMLASSGQFIVLLNPDTVVTPNWLKDLRKRAEDPRVGAVGPTCDMIAGYQYVEHHLAPGDARILTRDELPKRLKDLHRDESQLTSLLMGLCVMLRREVLGKVGLLDEGLFLGSDDLELSLRLRSHGYKLLIARDVFVRHVGGASFASVPKPETERMLAESTAALRRKLRDIYAPAPEPTSEEVWGIGILPQEALR